MELLGLDISENYFAVSNSIEYPINYAETHVYYVNGWYEIENNRLGKYILLDGNVVYFEIKEL